MSEALREFLRPYRIGKAEKGAVSTHYSMAGGKFHIPDEQHTRWLKLYAAEWARRNGSLFIVELRTPVFRMHFDIDMVQHTEPSDTELHDLARFFSGVFKTFYPDVQLDPRTFLCIVLKAPSMQKKSGDVMLTKTGVHMIWPWLHVDKEQALRMRESCVAAAVRILPPRLPPLNDYNDVIDKCVLEGNGLRMVGSDKCTRCEECGAKGKEAGYEGVCLACAGCGFIPSYRIYVPVLVVDGEGNLDAERLAAIQNGEDRYPCVKFCSVRSSHTAPTKGFTPPPLAPPSSRSDAPKSGKKTKVAEGAGNEVANSSTVFTVIQEFVQRTGPQWAHLQVTKVLRRKEGAMLIKVEGEGSSYCTNVHRAHTSSTIYFVLRPNGLSQRCYSKKDGTAAVPCRDYHGPLIELPVLLRTALFESGESVDAPVVDEAALGIKPPRELPADPDQLYGFQAAVRLAAASHARMVKAQAEEKERASACAAEVHAKSDEMLKRSLGPIAGVNELRLSVLRALPMPTDGMSCAQIMELDKQRAKQGHDLLKVMRSEMQSIDGPPTKRARAKKCK